MRNVLEIEKLTVSLPKNADRLYAIEDINLIVNRNEIVCVVGESDLVNQLLHLLLWDCMTKGH